MAISEDRRHEMYEGLIEVLGRERATTLMEHLPPVGWADVATKRDLDQQTLVLRRDMEVEFGKVRLEFGAEIGSVRTDLGAEIASLRTELGAEIASVRTELRTEIASVRTELRTEIASVRTEIAAVEARFERALRDQTRVFFLGLLTSNATLAALAFAAARLV
jgi:hypothetical protein